MAGSFSDAQEKAILDNRFGGVALATPATLFFALITDANSAALRDAGTVTEVATAVWTNYQRAPMTNNTTNFPAATGTAPTTKTNAVAIAGFLASGTSITTAGGAQVTITGYAIYDAASGGNFLGWGDQTPNKVVSTGDTYSVPAGGFTATLD